MSVIRTPDKPGISSRRDTSFDLHFLLILLIGFVVVVVVWLLVLRLHVRCLLGVILFQLLGLLSLAQLLPFLCEPVGLSHVIGDDNVVKNSAPLPLPQVEAHEAEVGKLVDAVIIL